MFSSARSALFILIHATLVSSSKRPTYGWTVDTYSNIKSDSCFTTKQEDLDSLIYICDPDSFLNEDSIDSLLSDDILIPKLKATNLCSKDDGDVKDDGKLEVVIAIAEKTDFQPYYSNYRHRHSSRNHRTYREYERQRQKDEDDQIIEASKLFTMDLHNKWGIGKHTNCGDTGVLIYISIADRVVYISKGSALNDLLISSRIDTIIKKMKPYLRSNLYKEALETSMYGLLTQIEKGPPSFVERYYDMLLFAGILTVFAGIFFGNEYVQSRKRRRYAEARMHLSQLDRDNALALQGQYRCTSCPICFEPFQNAGNSSSTNDTTDGDANDESEPMINNQQESGELKGSDGLPLRLLRCGHVFDETCYQTWVSTGQGDVTKCPICKEDIGGSSTTANNDTTESTRSVDSDGSTGSASLHRRTTRTTTSIFRNRNYDYYRRERLFRLARLANRYPQYIRPNQITRWGDANYNGRLVQDDGFVRSDPVRQAARDSSSGSRGYSSSSSGRSFGGGRSSGGGGGRW